MKRFKKILFYAGGEVDPAPALETERVEEDVLELLRRVRVEGPPRQRVHLRDKDLRPPPELLPERVERGAKHPRIRFEGADHL